ncbi:hypothetical protein [Mesorhizobium sp. M0276]|uniref:hypothetical protein n=1 Tax=Mesorhizobium sp. M0276 TaxID=2956928 RepID=UPI003339AD14
MHHSVANKVMYGFTITLTALSIISFLLLTPLGHWQADEFHFGYVYRTDGVNALLFVLKAWAPRPFSEAISYLYHYMVEATGRRHIGALLFVNWAAMIAASLTPILFLRASERKIPLLLASTVVLLSVVGRNNSEVFYWVQAALPNMPTLAAVFFVASAFLFAESSISRKSALASLVLVIGALSSEIGAIFAWIMSFFIISYWALYRRRFIPISGSVAAIFVPALIVSGLVFFYLMNGRLSLSAEASAGSATARIFSSSLLATIKQIVVDALFYGNNVVGIYGQESLKSNEIYIGILPKLALFTCSFLYFRTVRAAAGDRVLSAVLFLSSAGTAFFVLFMTFYQFGGQCCGRHVTMEQALLWVAIVAAGRFVATFFSLSPVTRTNRQAICIAALVSVVPSILLTARPLAINYSRFSEIRLKNDYIWDHRLDASSTVVLKKYQPGEITGGGELYFQEGLYEKGNTKLPSAWAADFYMQYFGKDKLMVDGR